MKNKVVITLMIVLITIFISQAGFGAVNRNSALNPGFEKINNNNALYWANEAWDQAKGKTEFKLDNIIKHSGKYSVCIINNSQNDARLTQVIGVKADKYYKISCWIKTEGVSSAAKGANISVKGLLGTSRDITGTQNWQNVEVFGKTGAKQDSFTVTFGLGGYGSINSGKAWFDDVTIEELDYKPVKGSIINLFEDSASSESAHNNNSNQFFALIAILSIIIVLVGFLIYKTRKVSAAAGENSEAELKQGNWRIPKLELERRDIGIMIIMTAVYLCIALMNLGSFKAPQTSWTPARTGESFVMDFGKRIEVSRIYYFNGLGEGKYIFEYLDDKGKYSPLAEANIQDPFSWKYNKVSIVTDKIKVVNDTPGVVLNEMAVFTNGSKNPVKDIRITDINTDANDSGKVENLLDEQNTVDYYHTFLTGIYFDEIYHAKTAFEQLTHVEPTETSHPPLGKILISLGILIFGMVPFGWRIIGTLFGAAMIPLMYIFAKKMFSKSFYAFCAAFLMMFDFMHFVQTRIATIDVYGTFFIILMYYYMYDTYMNKSYQVGFKKSLKPLLLSGLFFGLGAASKWIALYGAGGLALLFFASKWIEYRDYKSELKRKSKAAWVRDFVNNNILITFLWCVLFFIIIPGIIYYLSYIPFLMVKGAHHGLKDIINAQVSMYDYHKNLVADHFFKSKWYTWPFDYKPMWYYSGSDLAKGMASSITSMGNPAVWWMGVVAVPLSVILACIKRDKKMVVIFTAMIFQYVPWMFISRITFIYHFFSTVPFLILAIVYIIQYFVEKIPSSRYAVYGYLALVLGLFIMFYPVLSGMEVPKVYIDNYLRWFKQSWYF